MALSTPLPRSARRIGSALWLTFSLVPAIAGCGGGGGDSSSGGAPDAPRLREFLAARDIGAVAPAYDGGVAPDPRIETTPPDVDVDPEVETPAPETTPEPTPEPTQWCGDLQTFESGKTPTKIVHVAATVCSDNSGTGSESNPFCSIGRALQGVQPGTAVRVHAGTYAGGGNYSNVVGTAQAPIWIGGAPGEARPKIVGGDEGLKLSAPLRYVVLHDLEVSGSRSHNVNVDDASDYANDQATRYVVIRNLYLHHAGDGSGIDNCLKVSGLNQFAIHDNEFYRCGMANPGSGSGDGIDLVGCHHGFVARNSFHTRKAVQVKGGSDDVEIRANHSRYIDEGTKYRVFNLGGSTATVSFRPPMTSSSYEARNVRLVSNVVEARGAASALAFAGCVDCLVANNTIVDPDTWVGRVLWENTAVVPPRAGRFVNNIVYWDSSRTGTELQVGTGVSTASTFAFDRNLWFDWRNGSTPNFDAGMTQTGAIYADPDFIDAEFHIDGNSPAAGAGEVLQQVTGDFEGACFGSTPSIGALLP